MTIRKKLHHVFHDPLMQARMRVKAEPGVTAWRIGVLFLLGRIAGVW